MHHFIWSRNFAGTFHQGIEADPGKIKAFLVAKPTIIKQVLSFPGTLLEPFAP